MKKSRVDFWEILSWVVLGLIALWLILKVTGVINTPLIIQYAPYFGAVYLVGYAMHKLDNVVKNTEKLNDFSSRTIKEIHDIKINCVKNHN